MCQLLDDISSYLSDAVELKREQNEMRKRTEDQDKQKGEEMRKAALEGLASKCVPIGVGVH